MTYRFASRQSVFWIIPIVALSTLGYAFGDKPIVEPGLAVTKTGVVLDAQTHQPLPGVYVVARWLEQSTDASLLGQAGKVEGQCLLRTVVRTDEHGRFEIPAAALPIASDRALAERKYFWDASAYAPGYAVSNPKTLHPAAGSSPIPATQALEPILLAADHAAPEQRITALQDTLTRFTCQAYSAEPVPVAEQVYAEAYSTACLPEPNDAARVLGRLRDDATHRLAREAAQEPCTRFKQVSSTP
jgi:hypothetical protein